MYVTVSLTWGRPWSTCRCPWWCLGRRARCCSGSAPSCCTVGADQLIQNGRHQGIGRTERRNDKSSSYIRKFRIDRVQSYIWLMASSYMVKYLRISHIWGRPPSYMTLQLLHSEISLYMRKILFHFFQWWRKVVEDNKHNKIVKLSSKHWKNKKNVISLWHFVKFKM